MQSPPARQIEQVVSAAGWWAYSVPSELTDHERDVLELWRLTCFALVRYEDGILGLCGLDETLDPMHAPETCSMVEYVFAGLDASEGDARRAAIEKERRDARILRGD